MLCRKNQATLTAQEKSRFVAAVLTLKANGKYDQYVTDHRDFAMGAHRGPAFLPWHRELLRRFEQDLQSVDSSVTLPYWDWSVDNSPVSSIWDPDLMGGNGRVSDAQVMTGAFAFSGGNWPLNVRPPGDPDQFLKRQFGVFAPSLPTPADVTATLNETPYDVAPWNTISASGFRNKLEGFISGPQMHNLVHVWVGGSMLPMQSPNDPVFFLHHCFVDKLWADWQAQHSGLGYVPVSGGPAGHNLNDAMEPWAGQGETVTPASVLDHHGLGYAYDTEPECRKSLLQDKGTRKIEKIEKIETKELKFEKIELKEHMKREKFENKEKPELKEHMKREKFENKEFAWEKPPRLEGKTIRELPDDLIRQGLPAESPEERLTRVENAIGELSHFIGADLRPDLNLGALSGEQDLGEADMEALRKQQAQAKDDLDIGKLHEH
jgi:hypothetical protein